MGAVAAGASGRGAPPFSTQRERGGGGVFTAGGRSGRRVCPIASAAGGILSLDARSAASFPAPRMVEIPARETKPAAALRDDLDAVLFDTDRKEADRQAEALRLKYEKAAAGPGNRWTP